MNIGEISKPSVERAQTSKKVEQQSTTPVTESKQVVDSVHLSDESKRRFKKKKQPENILNKDNAENPTVESSDSRSNNSQSNIKQTDKKMLPSKGLSIDLRA